MPDPWPFVRSITLREMGKLTLREDTWRLPTGDERAYPVLQSASPWGWCRSSTRTTCC